MTNSSDKNRPSPWSVLNDFAKTVITLSSGLLVITVTFLDQLLESNIQQESGVLLTGMWVSLILSMLAGLLAAAFIINYLKYGERGNLAIFMANTAFFLLLLAGIFMGWFGMKRLNLSRQEMNLSAAVELAKRSLDETNKQSGSDWIVIKLSLDEENNRYLIDLRESKLELEYSLVISRTSKSVEQIELKNNSR